MACSGERRDPGVLDGGPESPDARVPVFIEVQRHCERHEGFPCVSAFPNSSRLGLDHGSVTAPRSAPVTSLAYLARTPVGYRGGGTFQSCRRRASSPSSTSMSTV